MKHFFLLILGLMCMFSGSSCERSGGTPAIEYFLQMTDSNGEELIELAYAAEGGEQSATITTNGMWLLTPDADWISISPDAGVNDAQICVIVEPNTVQEVRTADIEIALNDKSWGCFSIVQDAAAPVYHLQVTSQSPDPAEFGIEGGELNIELDVNSGWSYSVMPESEWITQIKKESKGLKLQIAEADYAERSAEIIFTSNKDESKGDTVKISQARKPLFEVSADSTSFGENGGKATFAITSNIGWKYEITPAAEWITESKHSESELVLNISALSFDNRSVDVIFSSEEEAYSDTITITQTGRERIVADMLDVVFNADGTAEDISPMKMKITTYAGTQLMTYYNSAYDRYVAHFNNTMGQSTTTSFYKVDFSSNGKFKNALNDGHTLETIFCVDESVRGKGQEIKIFTAHQAGGTGIMLTTSGRGNDITFLPNVSSSGSSTWRWAESGVIPNPYTYYHVVGVWDKAANVARIYINGKQRGTVKTEGNLVLPSGANYQWFGIGGDPGGASTASNCLKGDVVVARIYDAPMTAAQVAQLYEQSTPVGELPSENFSIGNVAFLSGCELGVGYGYAIHGTGWVAGDCIEFESATDTDVKHTLATSITDNSAVITIPSGFASGKYQMTAVRGTMRFPLGVTELTISDTPTIPSTPKIIAHRGVHSSAAENSLESFIAAQDLGVYGSELDVHITADNKIITNHDTTTGGVKIEQTNYDDLPLRGGKKIPLLVDYFEQLLKKPGTKLIIELKTHSSTEMNMKVTEEVVRLVKEYQMESHVEFIAYNYGICKRLAELMPHMNIAYLTDDKAPRLLIADGIRGIDYEHGRLLTTNRAWIKQAHDLGMYVNTYTVNNSADMLRCIAAGVDFITTDNCPLLQSLIGVTYVIPPTK